MKQPAAPEAEKAVISAVLSSSGAALMEIETLKAEHFADLVNARVYELARGIWEGGGKPDYITVGDALEDAGIPRATVEEYRESGGQNLPDYSGLIESKWRLRRIIEISNDAADAAMAESPENVLDALEQELIELRPDSRTGLRQISGTLSTEETSSFSTGYGSLDAYLGGLGRGRLVTIASRPGVGKTTLALNIAANAAAEGRKVALFSLEMSYGELVDRIVSRETHISGSHLRNKLGISLEEWSRIDQASGRIKSWPLYIDDTASISVYEVGARSKKLRHESGLDLVVVDYIQLLTAPAQDNREQEIAGMTRGLKLLAKELGLPVVAMSQLNRQSEIRGGKPRQSDLRESGSIENDSDQIVFLWREEEESGDSTRPVYTNVSIGKNRHGPTGDFQLTFIPSQSRFE